MVEFLARTNTCIDKWLTVLTKINEDMDFENDKSTIEPVVIYTTLVSIECQMNDVIEFIYDEYPNMISYIEKMNEVINEYNDLRMANIYKSIDEPNYIPTYKVLEADRLLVSYKLVTIIKILTEIGH